MTPIVMVEGVQVATIQDAGRRGYTAIGVPVAGAWHRARYEAAVRLLTGTVDESAPAIEILAGALILRAVSDVLVSVTGPADVVLDRRKAAPGVALLVPAGLRLVVTPHGDGPVYVALSGWTPTRTLGSCSVDTFSGLGGEPLAVGDVLLGRPELMRLDRVGWFCRPTPEPRGPVRIVPLDRALTSTFTAQRWIVDRTARSGTRLRSEGWQAPRTSVESFPVVPGAIQVTPDGEAIVLGPDGSLTGGYPVVGVVTSVDRDRISTLTAGVSVVFQAMEPAAAAVAWSEDVAARSRTIAHPTLLA